jgi:hypothetical protein
MIIDCLSISGKFLQKSITDYRDQTKGYMENIETKLSRFIKDPRPGLSSDETSDGVLGQFVKGFDWFFNNPVSSMLMKYNPLTLALDAAEEGFAEALDELGISIPMVSFEPLVTILADFLKNEGDQILSFLKLIKTKLPQAFEDPSQTGSILSEIIAGGFWTLIKAFENLILTAFDSVSVSIGIVFDAISAEWKLSFISDMWKDFTGTPLTVLNVITWPIAFFMNLVNLVIHGKLPSEVWGNPTETVERWTGTKLADVVDAKLAPPITLPAMAVSGPNSQPKVTVEGSTVLKDAAPASATAAPPNQTQPFQTPAEYLQMTTICGVITQIGACAGSLLGLYDAIFSIKKAPMAGTHTATETTPLLVPTTQIEMQDLSTHHPRLNNLTSQPNSVVKPLQEKSNLIGMMDRFVCMVHLASDLATVVSRSMVFFKTLQHVNEGTEVGKNLENAAGRVSLSEVDYDKAYL